MNKEIYERIADTYLGKRNIKEQQVKAKKKKQVIVLSLVCTFAVIGIFILINSLFFPRGNTSGSIYLLSERYPLKLTFDLNPPQSGIKKFSHDLPTTDARNTNYLSMRIKGARFYGFTNILRIEIENARREKDSFYVKAINGNWKDFSIELSSFKKITDWSKITNLSFVFEDWNVSSKSGIIYVDNIRFNE